MRFRTLAFSLAAAGLVVAPVVAQAADAVAGTIVAGQGDVLVSRDGSLLRASPNMSIYAGDRVMTRAGGSAQVALASGERRSIGSSSMVSVAGDGQTTVSDFDSGRAGYSGSSSALAGPGNIAVVVLVVLTAAGGAALALNNHKGAAPDPIPVSS